MNLNSEDFIPFQSSRLDIILNREKVLLPQSFPSVKADEKLIVIEKASVALGLPMLVGNADNKPPWQYFITICFPTKESFAIKHQELVMGNRLKICFSKIKYGNALQQEQYEFIKWTFNQYIKLLCDYYSFFFEQTESGNIHVHGRIASYGKKKTMKDIKIIICNMFGVSAVKYPRMVDVKVYEHDKWHHYETKLAPKAYQTTEYPHYTNISP